MLSKKQGSPGGGNAEASSLSKKQPDLNNKKGKPSKDVARPFLITFFRSKGASTLETQTLRLWELRNLILTETADRKTKLRWLKAAKFGTTPTKKKCLRHNANVLAISGAVGEHDDETMSFGEAIKRLRSAMVTALVYTSPSHTEARPRWRVVAPTSHDLPPTEHAKQMARINGVLGGALSPESFTLSQAYYFGKIGNNPDHRCEYTIGEYLDQRDDLDVDAIGKQTRKSKSEGTSQSIGSGGVHGFEENLARMGDGDDLDGFNGPLCSASSSYAATHGKNLDREALKAKLRESIKAAPKKADRDPADIPRYLSDSYLDNLIETAIAKYGDDYITQLNEMYAAAHRQAQTKKSKPGERRTEQIAQNVKIGDDITDSIYPTVLTLKEMIKRLVFVGMGGAIVDRETGRIRKKEVATQEYAASLHFYMEDGERKSMPALKAWLASRERVTVDVLAWVPGSTQICQPPEAVDGARTAFNTWRGLTPMQVPKDWKRQAQLFVDHVTFLMPVKSERRRFLMWLAQILQQPDVLPHTAYLMTTPRTGIGRNLLASMITRVLRGHVAAGVSLPELLDGGYTGRLSRKLLAIVDEAREGSGEKRYQRAERLKSLITEEHRHINVKYGLQSVEKNCCRWLMFSNHPDAIPFDNTDRRIIVIDNPTEPKPVQYYERLFALLDDQAFIASVWMLLMKMDISDFKPGEHAATNEAKTQALHWMRSDVERGVVEFKEDLNEKVELVSRQAIRDHVSPFDLYGKRPRLSENHLTHAIASAGMINARRRVVDKRGDRHSVVIVRGGWTMKSVEEVPADKLLKAMGLEPPDTGSAKKQAIQYDSHSGRKKLRPRY